MDKKRNIYAAIYFIVFLIGSGIFAFYFGFLQSPIHFITVDQQDKGVLDLSGIDFEEKKIINLEGEYEFYWKQLLKPADFQNKKSQLTGYLHVPGLWNEFQLNDSTELGGDGYATFRLLIKVPEDGRYGLKIKEFDCAYTMWANGKLVAKTGKVADNKSEMIPSWQRKQAYFDAEKKEIDLIIQVSNFHHRKGGPEDMMLFGKADSIRIFKLQQYGAELFVLGVIIIMGIYHLGLFILRHKEYATLMFSLFCFVMALRLLLTSEKILLDIFPHSNWRLMVVLEYLGSSLVLPVMVYFFYFTYPKDFKLRIIHAHAIIMMLFSFFIIVTPPKIFSYTPIFYQIFLISGSIFIFMGIIRALKYKRPNAVIFLLGIIFVLLIAANETLYYAKILKTSNVLHLGIFVFVFSQSFALSRRFSSALFDVENLSEKLNIYNRELENIVQKRTAEVIEQKEELLTQAEELRSINEKLRELDQFKDGMVSMLVHDLKNPLNAIIAFSDTQKNNDNMQFINHAGKEMLTLVMNILDVQRYENAEMKLEQKNHYGHHVAHEAARQVEVLLRDKNISFINSIPSNCIINVDREIVKRIFVNLLSNAIKFSDLNSKIVVDAKPEKNTVWTFSVTDFGPGIPENKIHLVFDRFKQVVAKKSGTTRSSGIGLSFCKIAVEAHGGKIYIKTKLGSGTSFIFTLPAAKGKELEQLSQFSSTKQTCLTDDEKENLTKFIPALTNYEIYQITALRNLIKEMKKNTILAESQWVKEIENAIYYCNQKKFDELMVHLKTIK